MIPSGDVAHVALAKPTVQKTLPFQAIGCQFATEAIVRLVHVIPSGEVMAAFDELVAIAQKTLPFQAIVFHGLLADVV